MPSPERIRALATDYDRTLTDLSLVPVERVLRGLERARAAGGKVIVVSGRDVDFLEAHLAHAADAIVAENGAFLMLPGQEPRALFDGAADWDPVFVQLGVPVDRGRVLASVEVEHEPALRDALAAAGIDVDLIRNRDRVMVLPKGVDKARGILAALDALGIAPEEAAAAGDGENDVVMLNAVGYGIAVSNAVDELKEVATHVTRQPGGDGLADWIERTWLPMLTGSQIASL